MKFKAWAASRGLQDLLERTTVPEDEELPTDSDAVKKKKLNRREKRKQQDAQALGAMTLRLVDSELHLALEAKSAKGLWETIAKVYSKGGTQGEMLKMRELVSLRMSEGDSVIRHVGKFKTIGYELNSMGRKMDEKFLCVLLMNSLPPSFDMLVTNLESMNIEEITLEKVAQKLQLEEQKRQAKKNAEDSSAGGGRAPEGGAFGANTKPGKKGRRRRQDPMRDPCDNCGKRGHWKKECWAPGGGAEGKRPKADTGASNSANMSSHALFVTGAVNGRGKKTDHWAVDSGATAHMTHNKDLLKNFVELDTPVKIAVAKTGMFVYAVGTGTFESEFRLSNGSVRHAKFTDVFLVPEICKNLLSVSAITKKGGGVVFDDKGVRISDKNGEAVFGTVSDDLFVILPLVQPSVNLVSRTPGDSWMMWHRRFGHLGANNLKRQQEMVSGFGLDTKEPVSFCNACSMGKSHKHPSYSRSNRSGTVLHKVHSDICGPMQNPSVSGYRHFITFIDDHSRMCFVYPMRKRSEAFGLFNLGLIRGSYLIHT